jgi:hypothetical protein
MPLPWSRWFSFRRALSTRRTKPRLQVEPLEDRWVPSLVTVGPNVNITRQAGNQAESAIAINPTNPSNLFAVSNGSIYKFSTNGGSTWSNTNVSAIPASCCDQQLAWDSFGNLFMTYLNTSATAVEVARSTDGGASFQLVAGFSGSVDQPSIAVGANSVWVDYNLNGTMNARGASVTGLGVMGAFGAAEAVNAGGSFGDIAIGPTGQVMLTWQDNQVLDGPENIHVALDPDGLGAAGFNPSTIVTSTNVGSFDPIPAQPSRTIDAEANLAWDRTGGPHNGRVYMVYTDEFPHTSNNTDILVRYSDNNGTSWSAPITVNDDGTTKSQFLPAIALDQTTGYVAVTWYDARNSPGNNTAQIFGSMSIDGAASFEPNVQISAGTSNATVAAVGSFNFGDYDKMDFNSGVFYRSWSDNSNSTGDNPNGTLNALDIYTAKVSVNNVTPNVIKDDGAWGYSVTGPGWTTMTGGYQNHYRVHPFASPQSASNVSRWIFQQPLGPGTYNIYTTWVNLPSNATNATYQIFDGSTLRGTVAVNQQLKPSDGLVGTTRVALLGSFLTNSGTFRVELSSVANGDVIADAIFDPPVGTVVPISGESAADSLAGSTLAFLAPRASSGLDTVAASPDSGSPFIDLLAAAIPHGRVTDSAAAQDGLGFSSVLVKSPIPADDQALAAALEEADPFSQLFS